MANLSTSWINSLAYANGSIAQFQLFMNNSLPFSDTFTAILHRGNSRPEFVSGFYCQANSSTECIFAILISPEKIDVSNQIIDHPQIIWSANRDNPVKINATLELTQDGDLVLADVDGTLVWSTNTSGKHVSGLNLTEMGNLVLFDTSNATVWQSFDHPTDSLVFGQTLNPGQTLTASVSTYNSRRGMYSLAVDNGSLIAYIESNPPQVYFDSEDYYIGDTFVKLGKGRYKFSLANTTQFIKLEPDGHLKVYAWGGSSWGQEQDLLTNDLFGDCGYPMVCGKYGICSDGQCSCSQQTDFSQINFRQPNLGCSLNIPISCDFSQYHKLVELKDIDYFVYRSDLRDEMMELEDCMNTCLKNCTCKAAVFAYNSDPLRGGCLLLSEVVSLINIQSSFHLRNSSMFVKVQTSSSGSLLAKKSRGTPSFILGASLGAFIGVLLMMGACFFLVRRITTSKEVEEDYLDQVPGMPTRFAYKNLKDVTENFNKKLGEGGFGSVFEWTLSNGTKVAVKHLSALGQVKKSFLAEIETIGSIHHVNLVRLIGFCAEKSYRLLVHEYMCNGSLDRWIFRRNQEDALGWQSRRKIILDIAKGLAYLHEDCRQKIFHLDIKPQNILLDENFNAKVSDFGLSKLIDKDQSQVVTTLRGTLGYMAPEWLGSIITEKVDVYSFGVVVLEIVCGRKNLDRFQPEEDKHLLSLFQRKARGGQLSDMVDKCSEDMQLHGPEIVETMRLADWCLQSDFKRRPSMSTVVKVLEGSADVESDLDYSFVGQHLSRTTATVYEKEDVVRAATPLLPSVLSGPSEDMQLHGPEIVKTMRLAAWCLQSDFKRRPSMSTVFKVLEGSADVESDLDYSFVGQHLSRTTATVYEKEDVVRAATPLLPSVLSGPR
ncbi:unnamed protein product [Ilex paraguariensis]|uniref:Receptor-like serine/threonine-protein kinase n=1 Tax=Ilex paraguariensis TaxID=185542 RepID=A0ABC8U5M1_9AQUA